MTNEFKEGVHAMSESRVTRSITPLCSAYTGEQLQHAGISDMADICPGNFRARRRARRWSRRPPVFS